METKIGPFKFLNNRYQDDSGHYAIINDNFPMTITTNYLMKTGTFKTVNSGGRRQSTEEKENDENKLQIFIKELLGCPKNHFLLKRLPFNTKNIENNNSEIIIETVRSYPHSGCSQAFKEYSCFSIEQKLWATFSTDDVNKIFVGSLNNSSETWIIQETNYNHEKNAYFNIDALFLRDSLLIVGHSYMRNRRYFDYRISIYNTEDMKNNDQPEKQINCFHIEYENTTNREENQLNLVYCTKDSVEIKMHEQKFIININDPESDNNALKITKTQSSVTISQHIEPKHTVKRPEKNSYQNKLLKISGVIILVAILLTLYHYNKQLQYIL